MNKPSLSFAFLLIMISAICGSEIHGAEPSAAEITSKDAGASKGSLKWHHTGLCRLLLHPLASAQNTLLEWRYSKSRGAETREVARELRLAANEIFTSLQKSLESLKIRESALKKRALDPRWRIEPSSWEKTKDLTDTTLELAKHFLERLDGFAGRIEAVPLSLAVPFVGSPRHYHNPLDQRILSQIKTYQMQLLTTYIGPLEQLSRFLRIDLPAGSLGKTIISSNPFDRLDTLNQVFLDEDSPPAEQIQEMSLIETGYSRILRLFKNYLAYPVNFVVALKLLEEIAPLNDEILTISVKNSSYWPTNVVVSSKIGLLADASRSSIKQLQANILSQVLSELHFIQKTVSKLVQAHGPFSMTTDQHDAYIQFLRRYKMDSSEPIHFLETLPVPIAVDYLEQLASIPQEHVGTEFRPQLGMFISRAWESLAQRHATESERMLTPIQYNAIHELPPNLHPLARWLRTEYRLSRPEREALRHRFKVDSRIYIELDERLRRVNESPLARAN